MMPCRATPAEQGFSLIETLIALAIVAGMSALLVDSAIGQARSRAALRERREGLLLAQSALDTAYDPNAPEGGTWHDYRWRIARAGQGNGDPFDPHPLERVAVVVERAGRQVAALAVVRARP
jgi:prepilin-type N-terminal cleavage/methylation domain-containing protein